MIVHISPLFTIAQICGVALILTLIAGFFLLRKKDELEEEFDEEWMDREKWEQTK